MCREKPYFDTLRGAQIPGRQVAVATKFFTVTPNICGPSVVNILHVVFMVSRFLGWFLSFWKICASMNFVVFV
jgi:hypothetical protein